MLLQRSFTLYDGGAYSQKRHQGVFEQRQQSFVTKQHLRKNIAIKTDVTVDKSYPLREMQASLTATGVDC